MKYIGSFILKIHDRKEDRFPKVLMDVLYY